MAASGSGAAGGEDHEGRAIVRGEEAPEGAAFRAGMQTDEAKAIYRRRGEVAEFPNAWLKEKIGSRRFRLQGLAKVTLEALWACLAYNIQQWIRFVLETSGGECCRVRGHRFFHTF